MATSTDRSVAQPRLGVLGMLRWAWRQLTSMRTALFLLLLVSIAAVPGSIFPQRIVDVNRVLTYLDQHPDTGPWLDRLGFFDVYSSPWFSAIYLLLMVSLIGCVIPRAVHHWRAMRTQPPAAPRRLNRLPQHRELEVAAAPDEVLAALTDSVKRKHYRIRKAAAGGEGEGRVLAAETGYLRETGNLLFHAALLGLTIALAWGHLVGWRGDKIVPVGQTFANAVGGYDTWSSGPWVDISKLDPFSVRIDKLNVTFQETGSQTGAPREFIADTTVTDKPGDAPQRQTLAVNDPLDFGGASTYLLGNGYAPTITVRDTKGDILYRAATPFLPKDNLYNSTGAIKVPAASPKQIGFSGLFLPTAYVKDDGTPASAFPDARRPGLYLEVYTGNLFPKGRPENVYTLDTTEMKPVMQNGKPIRIGLQPGQTVQLPDGLGTITFDKVDRWAGISTRYDPAKPYALGSALLALLGLVASLVIRRRRVFARVTQLSPAADGTPRSRVELGALAKGEDPMLGGVLDGLTDRLARFDRTGDGATARERDQDGVRN